MTDGKRPDRYDMAVVEVDNAAVQAAMLAEYTQLKDEQRSRIGFRDNFIYVTLGAIGAVGWAAIDRNMPVLLLLVPLVSFVLGWTYVRNDHKISEIGGHIGGPLKAEYERRFGGDTAIFSWDAGRLHDSRSNERKWIQMLVDLGVFVLPSTVVVIALGRPTVAAFYNFGPLTHILLLVAGLMTIVMGWQIASHSDARMPRLRSRRRTHTGGNS